MNSSKKIRKTQIETYQASDITDFTAATRNAVITSGITSGDTTHSPSADAVFGGLALKENSANKQNNLNYDNTGTKYPTVDAVNNWTRNVAKVASKTGLLSKLDTFNLTVVDNFTARIGAVESCMFWNEIFVGGTSPSSAIKSFPQKDYPLTQLITATSGNTNLNPLTTDGIYVRYLGYDKSGNVFSATNSFATNNDVFQIGFVTVLKTGSTVSFLGGTAVGARNVFPQPNLASNTDFDKVASTTTNVTIGSNSSASFHTNTGNLVGISINWKSTQNPSNGNPIDVFNYSGQTTPAFASINPNFLTQTTPITPHTLWTELEGGIAINNSFYNTTTGLRDTMNNNTASIKRVLIGLRGGIFVQDGEHSTSTCYADLATAKNNIFSHTFNDAIIPPGVVVEIARIAYIKGASVFTNDAQVYIVNTAGGSTGGGSSSIAPVSDATTVTKGILKLAGDLGGTADLPTVPTLANKVNGATSGTTNFFTKWSNSTTIVDSIMFGNGTSIGIGTSSPSASARLQVDSTTQGFLPPRMTSAQRTSISSPAIGLMVYQTNGTEGAYTYTSTGWRLIDNALWSGGTGTNSVVQINPAGANIASGNYSHAIGQQTTASGNWSHAEGYAGTASGDFTHVEGYGNTASNTYAHSEGFSNTATGIASHSEGQQTQAIGNFSHTEGHLTFANATASHAEGESTISAGYAAHAEGESTEANGYNSHAQGYKNIANGDFSHAEGYETSVNARIARGEGHKAVVNYYNESARGTGQGQYGTVSWFGTSFDDSLTELFIDGISDKYFIDTIFGVEMTVVAASQTTGDASYWKFDGLVKNIGGTTSFVGSTTTTLIAQDLTMAGTYFQVVAEDSADYIQVLVAGLPTDNVLWQVVMKYNKLVN